MNNDSFGKGPMDWDQFQNIFKNKNFMGNPFFDKDTKDPQWIEQYVQDILKNSLPNMNGEGPVSQSQTGISENANQPESDYPTRSMNKPTSTIQKELFEGHYHMILKVLLPDHVHPGQLQIHHAFHLIRIDGLPNQGPEIIQLPTIGKREGVMAVCKNNVLEVNIPKEEAIPFQEVNIVYE